MKNKILNKIKNNKLYVCTFIVGLIIISILYKLNNVTPLGDNSLLCVDFYHQYGPMLAELFDRIHAGSSFIYSFNMAMGLPFFRNFLNYLSSPFNIIMLFFSHDNVITSFSFIIGLKAVTSSVTMVYYLSKKFKTKELFLIPLGIIYAFSAYFSAYYWNIMWLDGMVMLPLITLGIERIVDENRWKFYSITLAIMLVANYFIGYMICIFAIIYFLIYLIYKTKFSLKWKNLKEELKKISKTCFMFGISSLIAGLLTAGLLLPMASSMASISATGGTIPTSQYYAFELVDYLKSHFTGVTTTTFASDTITSPNISCGILSVALLLAYLLNLEIPLKNKLCYVVAIGFFILAFFYAPLDYILHAFHVPNDLPYRYSFLYSFLLVVIGAYSLINIKKVKFPLLAVGYVFLMVLLLSISRDNWAGLTTNMIYINMILLTLYFIFYSAIYFLDKLHNLFYVALIVVASIDVIVSINYNWDISQVLSTFYEDYKPTKELLKYVEDYDDELFYRIENTNMMTLNDASWYNYYGMTTFSSMAYEDMAILQHNLGMPGNEINSYYYVQSTPIYDLMFNIKYFIGDSNDFNRYESIHTIDETVNKFNYNIGLIYGVNKNIKDWNYTANNPFAIQNDYIEKSTGVKNVLEPAKSINTEEVYSDDQTIVLKYTYENNFDNLYFYSDDYALDFVIIGDALYYKNDKYLTITENNPDLQFSYLEDYAESKVINISSGEDVITFYVAFNVFYSSAFDVYTINQGKLESAYNYLNKYKLDMKKFEEHLIDGNITLDKNMSVYTSIPYDAGWKVYVDNKLVETFALGDALLAFDCPEGTHKIKIKYEAPYMATGIIISLLTIIGMIIEHRFGPRIRAYLKTKED